MKAILRKHIRAERRALSAYRSRPALEAGRQERHPIADVQSRQTLSRCTCPSTGRRIPPQLIAAARRRGVRVFVPRHRRPAPMVEYASTRLTARLDAGAFGIAVPSALTRPNVASMAEPRCCTLVGVDTAGRRLGYGRRIL